ncbi:hypothetical protein DFH08DRAFT_929065 [Mycena albidolilacea]|uniref:Uncharacterized protein n=1 Tax=Mycena albidolilacea TaxID=1033008 RepID=A0AAD7AW63_9AGAR|nr:hypothetical protein DFH08DRAFT_929065 [Mycena albidolilacea]
MREKRTTLQGRIYAPKSTVYAQKKNTARPRKKDICAPKGRAENISHGPVRPVGSRREKARGKDRKTTNTHLYQRRCRRPRAREVQHRITRVVRVGRVGPLAAFEEKPLLLGGDAGVPAHERAHLPRVLCVHPRLEVGPEEGGGRGDWVVGVAGTVGGEIGNGWNLRRTQRNGGRARDTWESEDNGGGRTRRPYATDPFYPGSATSSSLGPRAESFVSLGSAVRGQQTAFSDRCFCCASVPAALQFA